MNAILLITAILLTTGQSSEEWQKELHIIREQTSTLQALAKKEQVQYDKELLAAEHELQAITERRQNIENAINTNDTLLHQLRERQAAREGTVKSRNNSQQLAATWREYWQNQQLRKVPGNYFDSAGKKQTAELYHIGNLATIAATAQPQPLLPIENSYRVPQAFSATTNGPTIYPVYLGERDKQANRSFAKYMQDGGILAWPIFALGIIVLLIALERVVFFVRHKNRPISQNDGRRFKKTLALIATASPLLGLLGTVLGIMQAFDILALAGQHPNPAALSGAISEALITTELGLIVALLALLVHHLCGLMGQKYE